MNNLNIHYQQLLGLTSSWLVKTVHLSLENQKVEISLDYIAPLDSLPCPVCGELGSLHDYAPTRSWRHLDTMQFETILSASVPRCRCNSCGVKTIAIPWTEGSNRFTLLFEAFALEVLQASSSVESACSLLGVSWHTANRILLQGVERGLIRREKQNESIEYLALDEKHFRKGQDYVTIVSDSITGKVLDVTKGRKLEEVKALLEPLAKKYDIQALSMDFWQAFISGSETVFPHAKIVHDRFHISQYLNEAVDKTRKEEHRNLLKKKDKRLLKTKYRWLENIENMKGENRVILQKLLYEKDLETVKVWELKMFFKEFWEATSQEEAEIFFTGWIGMVHELGNKYLLKVAKMLQTHFNRIITFFEHPITNGVAEGINSKIQTIKACARGFGSMNSYKKRILFHCGKLDMNPIIH